jgi:hypothetical protein
MFIVILVVQWQICDAELFKREIRRCELDHGIGQFPVEGISAKTTNENSNVKLSHDFSQKKACCAGFNRLSVR